MTWIVPSRSKTELYGRPRAAGVRGGSFALPCMCINWAVSISFVRTLQRLTCFGKSKSVRSPIVPPAAAPSSSPLICRLENRTRHELHHTIIVCRSYRLPSCGVVFEGCYRGACQVDTRGGRSHGAVVLYWLGPRCVVGVEGYIYNIEVPLASP